MAQMNITDATTFGQAVRSARKVQGLSQRALAARCGCSQRFVSELERGKETAELGKALHVLGCLGLSIGIWSERPAENGRAAIDQLATRVSSRLEQKRRTKTSLSDYLGS